MAVEGSGDIYALSEDRFLPSDYLDIISRAVDGSDSLLANFHSEKDLYLHLCDHPIVVDDGRKSFSLEKLSGKKCYMLAARDLDIVWGDTPRYWQWINLPESRFSEVAELCDVCWFDIRGEINMSMLSPGTNYAAYLVFTCKSELHGFDDLPVEGYVGVSGRDSEKRIICLATKGAQRQRDQIAPRRVRWFFHCLAHMQGHEDMFPEQITEFPKRRNDGWMEVELGECFVEEGHNGVVEVSLMEVNRGNWKRGLIVQGIEIRPKESKVVSLFKGLRLDLK